jgi:hypothetical protein
MGMITYRRFGIPRAGYARILNLLRHGFPSVFAGPVEPGAGHELHAAMVDARGHTIAIELDFVDPLRPQWRLLDRLGKLGRDKDRKLGVGSAAA